MSWSFVLKTCSRRLENVFKRYHQVKLFFVTWLRGVSNTFLRRTAKMDMPRAHFWENSTKFARVTKVYQILVFHFTTIFSGFLQRRIQKVVEYLQWTFFEKILNIHLSHTSKTKICLGHTSSRHIQHVFKTSSRRLQNVFKRYHQVKLFFLTCLRGVSNTFLRRNEKILQNLQVWQKFIEF